MAQPRQHHQPRPPARGGWRRGASFQGIGRSRGGSSTKVYLVDALGLPLVFEVTEGQRHDQVPAPALVERAKSRVLLGDKGYDSNVFRARLAAMKCTLVIPSKSDRVQKIPYERERYKARSEVECSFSLLEQARGFATRDEKTLRNDAAVVAIGGAMLWLRL